MLVDEAVQRLLSPTETTAFGTWEEHLRKHYSPTEQAVAFAVLAALSPSPAGLGIDALLGRLGRSDLKRASLSRLLDRLDVDGFIASTPDAAVMLFRNPLLRRWWQRFQPDVD